MTIPTIILWYFIGVIVSTFGIKYLFDYLVFPKIKWIGAFVLALFWFISWPVIIANLLMNALFS